MENSLKNQEDVLLVKEKGKEPYPVKKEKTKENENPDFLKIDKNRTALENFFENFMRQKKNPTQFEFYRVPVDTVEKFINAFKNPDKPGNKDFIDIYRIEPNDYLKKGQQNEQSQQSPKIDPEKVLWALFEKYGVTKETLEKTKEIDKLLNYQKTGLLTVTLKLDEETQPLRTDGRFTLRKREDGNYAPAVQLIRHKADLDNPYFGVQFTKEDKENLLKTGHLGRVVDAEFKKGEKTPVYISLDKLTNTLVACPKDWVKVPETYKGVQLNAEQKQQLSEGKPIRLENLVAATTGTLYNANVQFNADKKFFTMSFDNEKQNQQQSQKPALSAVEVSEQSKKSYDVPKTFRKKELTQDQQSSLKEGKTVYIDGLVDRNNKPYCGYITLNKETKKNDFMFPADYKKALAAGTVIPDDRHKTQVEVNNNGKTTEATKNVNEPLNSGQTKPTEKQSEKQEEKKVEQKQDDDNKDDKKQSRGRKVS